MPHSIMSHCPHDEKLVTLYHYGELEEADRATVAVWLATCAHCQQVLHELQAVEQVVPPAPDANPDTAVLHALRRSVAARIRERPVEKPTWAWPTWLRQPVPVFARLALATLLIAVGFGLGRSGPDALPTDETAWSAQALDALLLAQTTVEAPDRSVYPSLASIEDVAFDPSSGTVEIRYNTVNEVVIRGRPEEASVRHLLQQALQDEENPAARLYAARTLRDAATLSVAPDSQVVDALLQVLADEPNEGIRLQTLQALRALYQQTPLSAEVKGALLGLLLNDPNSALRIEALQTLTESSLARQDLEGYVRAAQEDSNGFIQYEAERWLSAQPAQPLEALPDGS